MKGLSFINFANSGIDHLLKSGEKSPRASRSWLNPKVCQMATPETNPTAKNYNRSINRSIIVDLSCHLYH